MLKGQAPRRAEACSGPFFAVELCPAQGRAAGDLKQRGLLLVRLEQHLDYINGLMDFWIVVSCEHVRANLGDQACG